MSDPTPDRPDRPDRPEPRKPSSETIPPAGPHADPDLTDERKTPGAGTLPDSDRGDDVDATTG